MKPTLSPEDKALVLEARAHWVRMRDDPEECEEEPADSDCALCCKYLRNLACAGCPVAQITGEDFCEGTPYGDASARYYEIRRTAPYTDARRLAVLTFKLAAQRVIDWIDENLLAESCELKRVVVPEPEELRRIMLESVERNKESTKRIVDVVCGYLPKSCRYLADDQQLLNRTEE